MSGHRRYFLPEVIQTSGMDCGPATLKALLEGFGIRASYGRLREACRTDVDGTSIDTLEEMAQALGLDAEQIMLPLDHVLLKDATALPAIAVSRTPTGAAHFIVIWRCHGPLVQILDPARGRLWLSRQALLGQLFQHSAMVGADAWRSWAGSDACVVPLTRRLTAIGISPAETTGHIQSAKVDPSWHGLARLDAVARMTAALLDARAITRWETSSALRTLLATSPDAAAIPPHYWSVQPATPAADGAERLYLRGAVLVRVRGHRSPAGAGAGHSADASTGLAAKSPELAAALAEPSARPLRDVFKVLAADGVTTPLVIACAVAIAACGVVFEGILLRSVLDISALLTLPTQGLAAAGVLAIFGLAMLGVEVALATAERHAGSRLEARLRIAFLAKIPRLADSYFQSRPIADMLERSHGSHVLRVLPQLAIRTLRVASELVVTTMAIAWLDPRMAGLAILSCAAAATIPLVGSALMAERDLKVRTHAGALARFHLDALLGRTAIDAHGADATIEREHERLLAEWAAASLALQRGSVIIEGLQMLAGFGLAAMLLFGHWSAGASASMLLMTYWVLNLPALGYELALTAREYPSHRSTLLRLLEPLGAPDAHKDAAPGALGRRGRAATSVNIDLQQVSVKVAGHGVLENVNLQVDAGTHMAIVGASGAGKSTLVGLLLGWFRPASGDLLVDGEPLTADRLDTLRQDTAWVDPTVQIWNSSLLDNLLYGSEASSQSLTTVLESAALLPVMARLPDGLATPLGEGGALLSAGERQRVRLGRAMTRPHARLVILDEPFLGLERERRRLLLAHARQRWSGRTLLYVTHDVTETRGFDRVIVMERGRIVEDGAPLQLAQMASSRYRRLLAAQEAVLARLTTGAEWKRIRLDEGAITQDHGQATLEQPA